MAYMFLYDRAWAQLGMTRHDPPPTLTLIGMLLEYEEYICESLN